MTVPAGTRIPLVLKHAISTKSVRPGGPVYLQTNFPVAQDNRILIPSGTYVQGVVDSVKRAGRVSGRAELLMGKIVVVKCIDPARVGRGCTR